MEVLARLENIAFSVKELQKKCRQLELENNRLKEKNTELEGVVKNKQTELNALIEKNKISKLAQGVSQTGERDGLKQQLDQVIAEIDQCLQLIKK